MPPINLGKCERNLPNEMAFSEKKEPRGSVLIFEGDSW